MLSIDEGVILIIAVLVHLPRADRQSNLLFLMRNRKFVTINLRRVWMPLLNLFMHRCVTLQKRNKVNFGSLLVLSVFF